MGLSVAHAHLRYLNPLPRNLGEILGRYEKVLVPELNMGQLAVRSCERGSWSTPSGLNKVKGKPFAVSESCSESERCIVRETDEPYSVASRAGLGDCQYRPLEH